MLRYIHRMQDRVFEFCENRPVESWIVAVVSLIFAWAAALITWSYLPFIAILAVAFHFVIGGVSGEKFDLIVQLALGLTVHLLGAFIATSMGIPADAPPPASNWPESRPALVIPVSMLAGGVTYLLLNAVSWSAILGVDFAVRRARGVEE